MNSTPQIETYLRELGCALSTLSESERADIIMETRSHLAERCVHMSEDEALRRMGPARVLAGQYTAIVARAPGAAGDESHAAQKFAPLASASMIVGGCLLWVCAIVSATLFLAELAEPTLVGVWLNTATGNVFVGAANPEMMARLTDIAGPWFLPIAAALAALAGGSGLMMTRMAWYGLLRRAAY